MTAIDLVGLGKSFGAVAAVKDLNLAVADKEFVALLGPSGCGKTTTMNMIAGIETPTTGRILFDGVDVGGLPPQRRNIGFVFQNYAIFTHMTVRQNLAFALKVRGRPGAGVRRRGGEVGSAHRPAAAAERSAPRLTSTALPPAHRPPPAAGPPPDRAPSVRRVFRAAACFGAAGPQLRRCPHRPSNESHPAP